MAPSTHNAPRRRDFIIGSLHRFGSEEGLDQLPAKRRATLGEVLAVGQKVVDQHKAQSCSVTDLCKVGMDLRRSIGSMTQSPVMRAVILLRALAQLNVEARAQLAMNLTYDWTDAELARIAAGGLRGLRAACVAADPVRAEHALARLDRLLAHAPVLSVTQLPNGARLVAECMPDEAHRAARDFELRAQAGTLSSEVQVYLVLPAVECPTPRAALLEYLHQILPGSAKVTTKALSPVSAQAYAAPIFVHWAKVAWQRLRHADSQGMNSSTGRAQSIA